MLLCNDVWDALYGNSMKLKCAYILSQLISILFENETFPRTLALSCVRTYMKWISFSLIQFPISLNCNLFPHSMPSQENLIILAEYCSEFLVHGVDVEGKKCGIEESLVHLLGTSCPIPVTYGTYNCIPFSALFILFLLFLRIFFIKFTHSSLISFYFFFNRFSLSSCTPFKFPVRATFSLYSV